MDNKDNDPSLQFLELEIARKGNRLKLSLHEAHPGEESTLRSYEEISVSLNALKDKCDKIVGVLNKANRRGHLSTEILEKLRETGQVFHDDLFTLNVKERLKISKAEYLSLVIDDELVHLPWELLHDGEQFLCRRFNMGRLVKTRQSLARRPPRALTLPLRMLVLADPEGDLKGAYEEGIQIRDHLDTMNDLVKVDLLSGNITPDFVREKMRNFDFVHFAGHADYSATDPSDSGWRLTKGIFKAADVMKMAGTAAMPYLVFSNACQSARTEPWRLEASFHKKIFGLANAFLLGGVKHYVGTFWEILDAPSRHFAMEFYKQLLSGVTVGGAVRHSRLVTIEKFGEETAVWASYVLYGDPTFSYRIQDKAKKNLYTPHALGVSPPGDMPRTREEVIDFSKQDTYPKKRSRRAFAVCAVLVFSVMLLWGYPGFLRTGTKDYEQAAIASYNGGNFEKALQMSDMLEDKDPGMALIHLIRANISLSEGNLDAAEAAYQKAIGCSKGTDIQRAQSFIGLGRIKSLRDAPHEAQQCYQRAIELAPKVKDGYLSQALLLESLGEYEKASNFFRKAQALDPNDQALSAMTKQIERQVALVRDPEKKKRFDANVRELIRKINANQQAVSNDGWTSPPLTVWLRDCEVKGYSLLEGQDRLLLYGITDWLIRHSRARLVERALLDEVVEELNLGTSQLMDHRTVLSLSKMVAARLIVFSSMICKGPQIQVSLRLIETETGRIVAAVNESFTTTAEASAVAEESAKQLVVKLEELYPLRGKVEKISDDAIVLNIGEMAGARIGQQFVVIDEDATLRVTSVEPDRSVAEIVKGKHILNLGDRVEAI